MTCIVGIVDKGTVHIGADSCGASDYDLRVRTDAKVFKRPPYVIGCTTSFRMSQLLAYTDGIPAPSKKERNLHRFMVLQFVPWMIGAFEGGGWLAKVDTSRHVGGTFLVGVHGHLFRVESDLQVGEAIDTRGERYDACGCASAYALGSMHTSRGSAKGRVRKALEAAAEFSAAVRPPFIIESVRTKGEKRDTQHPEGR